jgi:hypothetical protein
VPLPLLTCNVVENKETDLTLFGHTRFPQQKRFPVVLVE